jgi:hypothetical protein
MGNICCMSLEDSSEKPFNSYVILSPRNTWRPNAPKKKRYKSPKINRKTKDNYLKRTLATGRKGALR